MFNFCDFIQVYVFTTNHHLNVSLKFHRSVSEICQYFLLKNAKASYFFYKNISMFGYKSIKHL